MCTRSAGGVPFQAAYISHAVLTSNTCSAACNVPPMHADRPRQTSSDIKGYADFSHFLKFFFFFPILITVKCSQLLAVLSHLIMLHREEGEERAHLIFDLFVSLGNEIFCGAVTAAVWYFAS